MGHPRVYPPNSVLADYRGTHQNNRANTRLSKLGRPRLSLCWQPWIVLPGRLLTRMIINSGPDSVQSQRYRCSPLALALGRPRSPFIKFKKRELKTTFADQQTWLAAEWFTDVRGV